MVVMGESLLLIVVNLIIDALVYQHGDIIKTLSTPTNYFFPVIYSIFAFVLGIPFMLSILFTLACVAVCHLFYDIIKKLRH